MTFAFIEAEKATFPITLMCATLGVSASGYHAWCRRPPSARQQADEKLSERIRAIHTESRGTYGSPRVHADLRLDHGIACGRKRVARLMRAAGLRGMDRRRRRGCTVRDEAAKSCDDLVNRAFSATEPNRLWAADISEHPSWEGKVYVAVVLDAFSRAVVGWSIADHMGAELVCDAFDMAIWRRRPSPGAIHHSDSEYVKAGSSGYPWPKRRWISGWLVLIAPGLPDSHIRLTIVFPRNCRLPGSSQRGARLADGVTSCRAWPEAPSLSCPPTFGERCVDPDPFIKPRSDMTSMTPDQPTVVGGIDTHKDLHVAAVVDRHDGALLGTKEFSTTRAGYRAMLRWMSGHGHLYAVGVEGTGSYGAGVSRFLTEAGVKVFEVDRPDRGDRRRRGKNDPLDAEMAARAVLSGRRLSSPKSKAGKVEALRVLRLTRAGAVRSRVKTLQLLRNHAISAPDEVRDTVRSLTRTQMLRTVAAWRPDLDDFDHPVTATRIAMRSLARRILDLNDEIADLDDLIEPLVSEVGARLLERPCIGIETAGQLLVTAGDNAERLRSEAAWAMLCGVAPLPASSGKTDRHRLNRGGDRQANRALHMIVISRLRTDEATRAFVARKTAEGKSKLETIRCLKRYVAREVYPLLRGAD